MCTNVGHTIISKEFIINVRRRCSASFRVLIFVLFLFLFLFLSNRTGEILSKTDTGIDYQSHFELSLLLSHSQQSQINVFKKTNKSNHSTTWLQSRTKRRTSHENWTLEYLWDDQFWQHPFSENEKTKNDVRTSCKSHWISVCVVWTWP
jgi:hypothetical protein